MRFTQRTHRTKILFWDRSGLCLYYKRLEKGVFQVSEFAHPKRVRAEIEAAELALILEGIELANARRRARWIPEKTACFTGVVESIVLTFPTSVV